MTRGTGGIRFSHQLWATQMFRLQFHSPLPGIPQSTSRKRQVRVKMKLCCWILKKRQPKTTDDQKTENPKQWTLFVLDFIFCLAWGRYFFSERICVPMRYTYQETCRIKKLFWAHSKLLLFELKTVQKWMNLSKTEECRSSIHWHSGWTISIFGIFYSFERF